MSGTDIGAHGARETPVPMPNTAVKPSSGYNTWPIKAWENSTVPNYIKALRTGGLLSFVTACYFPYIMINSGVPHKIIFVGSCHGTVIYNSPPNRRAIILLVTYFST